MWAFLPEIVEAITWIAVGAMSFYAVFTTAGRVKLATAIFNLVSGSLDVAVPLINQLAPTLNLTVGAFIAAVRDHGAPILRTLEAEFSAVASGSISTTLSGVSALGESTPDNATAIASAAFTSAFEHGLASAGVAAIFEAAFPEKLNVLDGVAPMISKMAGFDEVAAEVLKPLYANAFGRSLDYHFRSIFKPELPDEGDAVTWHSRRLLTEAQLRKIFSFSGLKAEYEEPYVQSAYRAVQPRALATLFQDIEFPEAAVTSMLEFSGVRPGDLTVLLEAFKRASTKNVRQQYLSSVETAAERGVLTDDEVESALTGLEFSDAAKQLVKQTIATRKLQQLAEIYRKSISEAYKFGQITDAQYIPALEAVGIGAADAQAHHAVDSIALRGHEAAAAARAQAAIDHATTRAAAAAAIENFQRGVIDPNALSAALLVAGIPPSVVPFAVDVQLLKKQAHKVHVFGLIVGPNEAVILRERVAAIKAQVIHKAVSIDIARSDLITLSIPNENIEALLAQWDAQAYKLALPIS